MCCDLKRSVGFRGLAIAHFVIGFFCVSWQIGVLICATSNGSSFSTSQINTDNQTSILFPYKGFYYFIASMYNFQPVEVAHNMALSSMGFFAATIYIVTGTFAYNLSIATRLGAPSIDVRKKEIWLKLVKVFSGVGIVFSIILFSFSVYMAYIMTFWWEYFLNSGIIPSSFLDYAFIPTEALTPVILHAFHSIFALAGLVLCLRGCCAKMPIADCVTSVTYHVQHPAPYVIQQQGHSQQTYPAAPQPYSNPAGQQPYPFGQEHSSKH